jgi:hypothetical protein
LLSPPKPATAYAQALAVMPLDGQIPGKILLHNTSQYGNIYLLLVKY